VQEIGESASRGLIGTDTSKEDDGVPALSIVRTIAILGFELLSKIKVEVAKRTAETVFHSK
jgi:hypothetical protein